MRPADTSPEAWNRYIDLIQRMTPEQRFDRALQLTRLVRDFAEAGLRTRYPAASEREIFLRRVRQEWGSDLFRRVYGDVLTDD